MLMQHFGSSPSAVLPLSCVACCNCSTAPPRAVRSPSTEHAPFPSLTPSCMRLQAALAAEPCPAARQPQAVRPAVRAPGAGCLYQRQHRQHPSGPANLCAGRPLLEPPAVPCQGHTATCCTAPNLLQLGLGAFLVGRPAEVPRLHQALSLSVWQAALPLMGGCFSTSGTASTTLRWACADACRALPCTCPRQPQQHGSKTLHPAHSTDGSGRLCAAQEVQQQNSLFGWSNNTVAEPCSWDGVRCSGGYLEVWLRYLGLAGAPAQAIGQALLAQRGALQAQVQHLCMFVGLASRCCLGDAVGLLHARKCQAGSVPRSRGRHCPWRLGVPGHA